MEIMLVVSDRAGGTIRGETLDVYSEMFYIMLEDSTRFFFGSTPRTAPPTKTTR